MQNRTETLVPCPVCGVNPVPAGCAACLDCREPECWVCGDLHVGPVETCSAACARFAARSSAAFKYRTTSREAIPSLNSRQLADVSAELAATDPADVAQVDRLLAQAERLSAEWAASL